MTAEAKDIIDQLAGIEPGSNLDLIRSRRLQARENAQRSYLALFEPADFVDVSAAQRYAIAAFVAGVHDQPAMAAFYHAKFSAVAGRPEYVEALKLEIERGKTTGPYGSFPAGPLSAEDKTGLIYRVTGETRAIFGARLPAALEHTHMLIFHPRDAARNQLQALLDAGWSSTAIVTLSQLVAFLSFQVRSVAGLRALGASSGKSAAVAAKVSQAGRS